MRKGVALAIIIPLVILLSAFVGFFASTSVPSTITSYTGVNVNGGEGNNVIPSRDTHNDDVDDKISPAVTRKKSPRNTISNSRGRESGENRADNAAGQRDNQRKAVLVLSTSPEKPAPPSEKDETVNHQGEGHTGEGTKESDEKGNGHVVDKKRSHISREINGLGTDLLNADNDNDDTSTYNFLHELSLNYDASGTIPTNAFDPLRQPNTEFYVKEADLVAERMQSQWLQNKNNKNSEEEQQENNHRKHHNNHNNNPKKPFKFHVYQIPDKYTHGALKLVEERWATSFCNRHKKKTTYTNLDWRHAHSLFTADILISKYLQFHPSHTLDPNEADIFIVPMMTHAYNCAGVLHPYSIDILSWVTNYPYYKLYNGHDHYLFWWRWGMHYKSVERFWKRVVRHFPNMNIISFDYLELMGRNDWQDFSLALKPKFAASQHWIVMPYPDYSPELAKPLIMMGGRVGEKDLVSSSSSSSSSTSALSVYNADAFLSTPSISNIIHAPRKIFFFFAGTSTIGGIRRWIKRNCDTHTAASASEGGGDETNSKKICFYEDFATSVVDAARLGIPSGYPLQMKNSLFCGHAAGDALSSRRPTSAVLAGCIPVMICDLCLYAFEDVVDYSTFSVFVKEEDVIDGKLMSILEGISPDAIKLMQRNLAKVRHHFVYNISGPPSRGDALDTMVSQLAVRGRVLRSYRRWWTANHKLPSDWSAYPKDPPPIKKYLKKGVSSAEEEKNFNNI